AKAARFVNQSAAKVVAVDLPTGVDADSGEADENAVRADATITFGAAKPGLLFSPGREYAGTLRIADIGFPPKAIDTVHPNTWHLPKNEMSTLLPKRHPADFKNKCGQILIVAGSEGMAGAASLTSSSAVRVGAGLVVLATTSDIVAQLAAHPLEVVKEPLQWQGQNMTDDSVQRLRARLQWAHAVAIGPGLGQSAEAKLWLDEVLQHYNGPLIIDADGLNLLQDRMDLLKKRQGETVLTPHPGEFLRLSGLQKNDLKPVPIDMAREFATRYGVHLLLKGAPSLLALSNGRVYINSAGNSGMATAGMGDVLTGVISGLAGQLPLQQAALLGMFLHSRAADIAIRTIDPLSLTAGDVLSYLPQTFMELRSSHD
ncbi:MAG: NAD(P)H-hydrate dehydratase, partial [Calditrichaeota bacterium]